MRRALIVGINNYPVAPLSGCINDASELAGMLRTHSNGSPNFDVMLKTDVGTRGELKGLIDELFKGEMEAALFYFSGHGYIDTTGGKLVTPDYQKNDEGVSMDEIMTLANKSKTSNRVVILDCCNSGAFGAHAMGEHNVSNLAKGTTILTSSKKDEASVEVNGHGVFTSLLLDALGGGAADLRGKITPGSIYAHIDQALGPWKQRPIFRTNIDEFISLRDIEPPVSLEIVRKIIEYFPAPQNEYKLNPSFEETNAPAIDHKIIEPHAVPEKVAIFKNLQKMQSVGLIVPQNEQYMYFAAMNSRSCKLTALGYHYWKLVKDGRI